MFLGVDHGTTAIRIGLIEDGEERTFSFPRERGVADRFFDAIPVDDVELAAVTYSMGDGLTAITPIRDVENRGVRSREGAGEQIGAGTELFDAIRGSDLDAVVLPGLHAEVPGLHPAFAAYSHCASGEKLAAAYRAADRVGDSFCLADVGSNTVTLAVRDGAVLGGVDAPVFAPGEEHGPLDLDAIRRVDAGESTATEEFTRGGARDREALASLVAMEMRAANLFSGGRYALTGRLGVEIRGEVEALLDREVALLDEWSAALGGAEVARDVAAGADEVLGIEVR